MPRQPVPAERRAKGIGATGGLADMRKSPGGSFIMYSAGASEQALDWLVEDDPDANSVYTRRLPPLPSRSDLSLVDVAKRVQVEVAQDAFTRHCVRGSTRTASAAARLLRQWRWQLLPSGVHRTSEAVSTRECRGDGGFSDARDLAP